MTIHPIMVRFWTAAAALIAISSLAAFVASATPTFKPSLVLDQGWNKAQRHLYYYTSQGIHLLPAAWLEALEVPGPKVGRFMAPEHLRPMGLIYANTADPQDNPYNWPIGFAIDRENGRIPQAGFNCALCHSAQIEYRGQAVRIDGGSTTFDPVAFGTELQRAVLATGEDPARRERFFKKAVALGYPEQGIEARFDAIYKKFRSAQQHSAVAQNRTPTPGRMDAVSSVADNIFAKGLGVQSNARPATAPVNAPYLWDIWLFDFVQYNASASGRTPMNRDVSQVIGQGGVLQLIDPEKPLELLPESHRWKTTIRPLNLYKIRAALDALKPPPWPEDVLGTIDRPRAAYGRTLFTLNCAQCHAVQVIARTSNPSVWHIPVVPLNRIATDPNLAANFAGFSSTQGSSASVARLASSRGCAP